ncbi:MAG: helix-turn-helix transcriptional regulator [Kiritimatiellae bacterium]|nr:helix-turn-helix transcriptional regulator [Kiritimatiellia bacterium]
MTPEKNTTQNGKTAETVGQRFASTREARGLSISEVGAATHMMEKHVRAIEADDFSALGAPIYAKGFIKLYAEFLGFDQEAILNEIGKKTFKKKGAPVLSPPPSSSSRSELKAEFSEAVQQQVGKVVTAAKNIPVHISGEQLKKWLVAGGLLLALVLVIALFVFGIKSCASALRERPTPSGRELHRSGIVIEEPAEPYLDSP